MAARRGIFGSVEPASTPPRTRLAPSPTGALHLGNARTFLITWALARANGWRIVMRVEDLDTPRVKPETIDQALRDLEWLGVDYDEGPIIQSRDLEHHVEAMAALAAKGLAYPCELTRTQIEAAASAPHDAPTADDAPGHEVRFPSSLRPADWSAPRLFESRETNWRFACPDAPEGLVEFDDLFAGPQRVTPADTIGDFVAWTKRGTPSYQLAVVVDDQRQRATHVVRGDDLLDSAARQTLLYRALGFGPPPTYLHLPLVKGADGRRLAKRHGDTRLSHYRARGVPPERIVALLARWSGVEDASEQAMSAAEFASRLALDRIPRTPIIFTPDDDAWLLAR